MCVCVFVCECECVWVVDCHVVLHFPTPSDRKCYRPATVNGNKVQKDKDLSSI